MNKTLIIYCDGGSRGNPGPSAYGFVAIDSGNNIVKKENNTLGISTNNIAEYVALIKALEWLKEYCEKSRVATVTIKMDSQLIVLQMAGKYRVKSPNLLPLFKKAKSSIANFEKGFIKLVHTKREGNSLADDLVNAALDDTSM